MKKLLLGLGAATAAIAPIATVVACGSSSDDTSKKAETKLFDELKKVTPTIEDLQSATANYQRATFKLSTKVSEEFAQIAYGSKFDEDKVTAKLNPILKKLIKIYNKDENLGDSTDHLSMGTYGPAGKDDDHIELSMAKTTFTVDEAKTELVKMLNQYK